jgi:hypothetical protein
MVIACWSLNKQTKEEKNFQLRSDRSSHSGVDGEKVMEIQ